MSPEQQRIAIAEACGWTSIALAHDEADTEALNPVGLRNGRGCLHQRLPDYLNDLNAMHEAEKTLSTKEPFWESEKFRYAYILGEIMWSLDDPPDFNCEISKCGWAGMHEVSMILSATAAQRAEAFLRTIGKWIDQP